MGLFYELCAELLEQVESQATGPMDVVHAKGKLSVQAGFMVGLVGPSDPDDPAKIEKLRKSARELGYTLRG